MGANAGRIADDIASGWDKQSQPSRTSDTPGYDPDYRSDSYAETSYDETSYDGLDRGWENFDDYGDPPPHTGAQTNAQANAQKRTYGDSLYSTDSESFDRREPYPDDSYLDDVGPDDVYEAEYRVIEPPSKPLPSDPLGDIEDEDDRYTR